MHKKLTSLQKVLQFHQSFDVPYYFKPVIPDFNRRLLRIRLLQEELDEFAKACREENIVEIFDALIDLQYVLDGTFLEFGLGEYKEEGIDEVHTSNLSKLDENGEPIVREDGKILKGPNYSPPNLQRVLTND